MRCFITGDGALFLNAADKIGSYFDQPHLYDRLVSMLQQLDFQLAKFMQKKFSIDFHLKYFYYLFSFLSIYNILYVLLSLPHRNDAEIAKICNLWTFWLAIQLIFHLFKIHKKAFLPNAPYMKKCNDILKISLHFLHLWSIGQKGFLSDFEKMVY